MIKILIVDDDEDCRLMIREAIDEGHVVNSVYEAATGEEALDFLYQRGKFADTPKPGLIYLDIDMPGISGIEALKIIRGDDRFNTIPIVIMTNLDDDREKMLAAQYGANSYTIKPSDPAKFVKTVIDATNYWIEIHERPDADEVEPDGA